MTEPDLAATDVAIDAPTPIVSVKPVLVSAPGPAAGLRARGVRRVPGVRR